jgi:hypothetical protein
MADYDLLWSTMTRYHGGLGGGDGYTTELPDGFKENQSRIADKVPSRLKCPISGELVSASPTHAHHAASASFRRLSLHAAYCPLYCTVLYCTLCTVGTLACCMQNSALSTQTCPISGECTSELPFHLSLPPMCPPTMRIRLAVWAVATPALQLCVRDSISRAEGGARCLHCAVLLASLHHTSRLVLNRGHTLSSHCHSIPRVHGCRSTTL